MSDALEMFRAMRPQSPGASEAIRSAAQAPHGQVDLHSLAMIPGTPGYNSRIPQPPCAQCGEDHVPTHDYGHPWTPQIHDEPVSAGPVTRRPLVAQQAEVGMERRVALYVGRGDSYVYAIEEAPDWESVDTIKIEPMMVLPLIRVARSLGVKVLDKTGGDLLMLEQEYGEPAQNHGRGAPSNGDWGARRERFGAVGAPEDQPGEGDGAAGELPEPVGERADTAG